MGRRLLLLLAVLGSLLVGTPVAADPATSSSDCAACSGSCCCAGRPEGCGCLAPSRPAPPSSMVRVQMHRAEVPSSVRPALARLASPPGLPVVLGPCPPGAPACPLRARLLLEQLALPPPA